MSTREKKKERVATPASSEKEKTKRVRSGCFNCKKRRVRCSEGKPTCQGCESNGLTCVYGLKCTWFAQNQYSKPVLKWEHSQTTVEGAADDHLFVNHLPLDFAPTVVAGAEFDEDLETEFQFGRDAEETTRTLVLKEHTSAYQGGENVPLDKAFAAATKAFQVSARKRSKQKEVDPNDFWPQAGDWLGRLGTQLVAPPSDLLAGSMNPADRLLFDYYVQVVSPTFTIIDDDSNGYRAALLPMVSSTPSLRHGLLALSAIHLGATVPSSGLITAARPHKSLALDMTLGLVGHPDPSISVSVESLASLLILCLLEIADGCNPAWAEYSEAAQRLIWLRARNREQMPAAPLPSAAEMFASRIFAFLDIQARAACRERAMHTDEWLAPTRYGEKELQRVDGIAGCSSEVLAVISAVTDLARYKYDRSSGPLHDASDDERVDQRAAELEHQLKALKQWTPHTSITVLGIDPPAKDITQIISGPQCAADIVLLAAEAKRQAALLFLACAFHGASAAHRTPIANLVSAALAAISQIPVKSMRLGLLWPLFVVGCECKAEEDRRFVLDRFQTLAEVVGTGNIARAKSVVEAVWRKRDIVNESGKKAEDDSWGAVIVPLSWRLTLG